MIHKFIRNNALFLPLVISAFILPEIVLAQSRAVGTLPTAGRGATPQGNVEDASRGRSRSSGKIKIYRNPSSKTKEKELTRNSVALKHYQHARTLLVEALDEFESGRRIARPDMLLDSDEWRSAVASRATELNRVIEPRANLTRHGTRYQAQPFLVHGVGERLPQPADGPKNRNTYGEEELAAGRQTETRPEPSRDNNTARPAVKKPIIPKPQPAKPTPEAEDDLDSLEAIIKQRLNELAEMEQNL